MFTTLITAGAHKCVFLMHELLYFIYWIYLYPALHHTAIPRQVTVKVKPQQPLNNKNKNLKFTAHNTQAVPATIHGRKLTSNLILSMIIKTLYCTRQTNYSGAQLSSTEMHFKYITFYNQNQPFLYYKNKSKPLSSKLAWRNSLVYDPAALTRIPTIPRSLPCWLSWHTVLCIPVPIFYTSNDVHCLLQYGVPADVTSIILLVL